MRQFNEQKKKKKKKKQIGIILRLAKCHLEQAMIKHKSDMRIYLHRQSNSQFRELKTSLHINDQNTMFNKNNFEIEPAKS
jgi:hypothetical protein